MEATVDAVGDLPSFRRRLGDSELEVFPLAISGKAFGWSADPARTEQLLDEYVFHGGNFLDTADSYASGRSETMIGNWLRSRRNRDRLVLATKVGKSADHPGLSSRAVTAAVEASLRRLRSDRIDLLYLHVVDPAVPFEETLLAVDELIRAGKVRYFGGSHHTGEKLIEARVASAQLGVARMVALQNQYSLAFRKEYEAGLARIARDFGLGVVPRFALASGFLSGRYRTRADVAASPRAKDLAPYLTRTGLRILAALDAIAAQTGAAPATIALAWLLSRPGVVAPVVSATSPEQIPDLVAAPALRLTRQQLHALDRASS